MLDEEANQVEERQKLFQRFREALRWLNLHEWAVILIVLVLIGAIWSFASVSSEVVERDPELVRLDERLFLALREPNNPSDPLGPPWVESAVRDITALGGSIVLSCLTIVIVSFLWLAGDRRSAVFILLAVLGGILFSTALKQLFARPRPSLVSSNIYVNSFSFPSGHATLAAATYLTLGTLLATFLKRRVLKTYVIGLAVLLTIAVGISRIYLGVHWPSDVIGGWAVGTAWALVIWLIARWLRK